MQDTKLVQLFLSFPEFLLTDLQSEEASGLVGPIDLVLQPRATLTFVFIWQLLSNHGLTGSKDSSRDLQANYVIVFDYI